MLPEPQTQRLMKLKLSLKMNDEFLVEHLSNFDSKTKAQILKDQA
jgi:hypothetical protein